MYIDKNKRRVSASKSVRSRRPVKAADETEDMEMNVDEVDEVNVEDTDLLFEAEDVAQLLAEVTGEPIDVTVNDDGESVVFAVGDDEFTVQAEGDEEVLETSRRVLKGKKSVKASTDRPVGRRFSRK